MPDRPDAAQLSSFLEGEKANVKGRIVLVGKHTLVPVNFTPPAKRRTDEEVRAQYDPDNPNGGRGGRGGGRGDQPAPPMTARQIDEVVDAFLVVNDAKLRVNDAAREHGQIIAFNNRTYDLAKAVPTVVMRNTSTWAPAARAAPACSARRPLQRWCARRLRRSTISA